MMQQLLLQLGSLSERQTTSFAGGVENALAIRFERSEMTKKLSS